MTRNPQESNPVFPPGAMFQSSLTFAGNVIEVTAVNEPLLSILIYNGILFDTLDLKRRLVSALRLLRSTLCLYLPSVQRRISVSSTYLIGPSVWFYQSSFL